MTTPTHPKPEDREKNIVKHIDDWIWETTLTDKQEEYAKFVLEYFRLPAIKKNIRLEWMKQFKLFCIYQGKRYRVTGASRLGDIWLAEDLNKEIGYDKRVDVTQCSDWSDQP